jgi:hypothetical protein
LYGWADANGTAPGSGPVFFLDPGDIDVVIDTFFAEVATGAEIARHVDRAPEEASVPFQEIGLSN